jgi:hypothetical protein
MECWGEFSMYGFRLSSRKVVEDRYGVTEYSIGL